ncbi:MAG TPA: amino acid racemase [Burkholderiaceae bacterium]|nr:amino acid racemase [Burkholderiaceae bacterium]
MLGVIGGMGPLATADFFCKLVDATPAERDEDHVPVLIHSVPQLPSRPAAILRNGPSPLPALLQARDRLLAAGASMLAMPCNTAHYWYDDLIRGIDVPFPHIADAVARDLPPPPARIAIIATAATLSAGIYAKRIDARYEWITPTGAEYEAAVQPCIDAVKRNARVEAGRRVEPVVAALLGRGAERVVLACTELPVALDAVAASTLAACIDSTAALARACIRCWREQKPNL